MGTRLPGDCAAHRDDLGVGVITIDDFTLGAGDHQAKDGPHAVVVVCEATFADGRMTDISVHPNFKYVTQQNANGTLLWTHGAEW